MTTSPASSSRRASPPRCDADPNGTAVKHLKCGGFFQSVQSKGVPTRRVDHARDIGAALGCNLLAASSAAGTFLRASVGLRPASQRQHCQQPQCADLWRRCRTAAGVARWTAATAHGISQQVSGNDTQQTIIPCRLQASSNCRGGPLDAYSRLLVSCQPPAAAPGVLSRPRHAHRLDAPTGGLLLAGKSLPGLRGLTRAFAER